MILSINLKTDSSNHADKKRNLTTVTSKSFVFTSEYFIKSNLILIIQALDECPANSQPSSRAARCGIEAALLDLWGKFVQKPVK